LDAGTLQARQHLSDRVLRLPQCMSAHCIPEAPSLHRRAAHSQMKGVTALQSQETQAQGTPRLLVVGKPVGCTME
jgi:hypothetical protein